MVLAYKFKGQRFDRGNIEGFIEATNFVYEAQFVKSPQPASSAAAG